MSKLTQAKLKEILHYNPKTGVFTWRYHHSNRALEGAVAGGLSGGYIRIRLFYKQYYAHRLAWLYMRGYDPENVEIDHKDRNRSHNRWENLRLASRQCQSRNCGSFVTNTSGIKGVYWSAATKKWRAQIVFGGKTHYLGTFKDFHNAVCARLAAEQCLNWVNCDSDSTAYRYVRDNIINTHPGARDRAPTSQGDRS